MKYETGVAYQRGGGEVENDDGWGDSLLGVKHRFFETGDEEHGVRLSVYPQAEVRSPLGSTNAALATPQTFYYLPVQFKIGFGQLAVTSDMGRELGSRYGAGWYYGAAVGYTTKDHLEVVGEVHRQTDPSFRLEGVLTQLGTRVELSERWTFMAALGRLENSASEVSLVGYIGLRANL